MTGYLTIDVKGCARCHGLEHSALTFSSFTHPVQDLDGTTWTHWALCPTNGEPILLTRAATDSPTANAYQQVAPAA